LKPLLRRISRLVLNAAALCLVVAPASLGQQIEIPHLGDADITVVSVRRAG
jgi:hypothetical protein